MVDQQKLGRYIIKREIARSNDIVWEAIDPQMGRRVALKELFMPQNSTHEQHEERLRRFRREAQAAGRAMHPNIVTVFEIGEDHGRYFIAMEYLEGDTLRQMLNQDGPVPVHRAIHITQQVLAALAHAHRLSVVHRDIKPENIHILPEDTVKITDFGIARISFEPNITMNGQVFGTPNYMAPEQISGGTIDCRTDIFAVGIVLLEMLTGQKPFAGDNLQETSYNICHREPAYPAGIQGPLLAFIQRCLAKDPDDRYSTADQALTAIGLVQSTPHSQPISYNSPVDQPAPTVKAAYTTQTPQAPSGLTNYNISQTTMAQPPSSKLIIGLKATLLTCIIMTIIGIGVWMAFKGFQAYEISERQKNLDNIIAMAMQSHDSKDYNSAIEQFMLVAKDIDATPNQRSQAKRNAAVSALTAGHQALRAGDLLTAYNYYDRAHRADPDYEDAVKYLKSTETLLRQNNQPIPEPDNTKSDNEENITPPSNPNDLTSANVYYQNGLKAYNEGRPEEALQQFNAAIRSAPSSKTASDAAKMITQISFMKSQPASPN
ncbi:MAG: protein kinase domain-containing protein [Armatimonadota bacterium]